MGKITTGFVGLLLLAAASPALRANSIFDFESLTLGATSPLSQTVNGVTATFDALNASTSVSVPGAYDIELNPAGIGSGPQKLIQTDPSVNNGPAVNLLVSLSAAQQTVTLPFALLASPGQTLTLTAFLNGTQVGTATATAGTAFQFYSIGNIAFDAGTGNTFNSFLLTPSVQGMGIDDVNVNLPNVSGVPEPATTALMFFGFAGMLAYLRRYMRHRAAANL